jgi:hypothetical protein
MSTRNSVANQQSNSEAYLAVELAAYQELLRQVRQTFNAHLVALSISVLVSVAGGILMVSGKSMEGTVSAITGSGAGAYFSQVAQSSSKESSKKLDKLVKEVKALRDSPQE